MAISDAYGAVMNPTGLDIAELDRHVAVNRKVVGFKGGEAATNDQLLTTPVDVLIPAAWEASSITRWPRPFRPS